MRREAAVLVAVAVLGLALAGAAPAPGARAARKCVTPSGMRTVVRSLNAVIVRRVRGRDRGIVYGCHRRDGTFWPLGLTRHDSDSRDTFRTPRLAGRYAGFIQASARRKAGMTARVVDLVTGRALHEHGVGSSADGSQMFVPGGSADLELKPNGSVAWLLRAEFVNPAAGTRTSEYQVHVVGLDDVDRLLAHGPDVDPGSLAVNERTVFWQQAGQAYAAPFD